MTDSPPGFLFGSFSATIAMQPDCCVTSRRKNMDLFKTFATDEKLEIEGRWVPFNDKTSFKIARAYNKHFARMFQREFKANKLAIEAKGDMAESIADDVMCRVMSKTVLLDWKGPVSINNEDLSKYSQENAFKALKLKEFRAWVNQHADDAAAFKIHQDEEDAKN